MASKTLSNGTLALKFMQNVQRVKQEEVTKLNQAEVKDDAEWEVSPQIREVWGLTSKSKNKDKLDSTHETSYLPFLFPSLLSSRALTSDDDAPEAGPSKVAGRRKFSKGKETAAISVETKAIPENARDDRDEDMPKLDIQAESLSGRTSNGTVKGRHTRPHPLVGMSASKMASRDAFGLSSEKPRMSEAFSSATPVLSMISGETSADVGLDMHKARKMVETERHPSANSSSFESRSRSGASGLRSGMEIGENSKKASNIFLRPVGVDAPVVKAEAPTARKFKKRARDGGEPLKSENSSGWLSPKPKKAKAIQQMSE